MKIGVPVVAQWLTNPTRNHEVAGSIPGPAQCVEKAQSRAWPQKLRPRIFLCEFMKEVS